jgi:hypothetical protein
MRIANLSGRLVLISADTAAVDVDQASEGRFGPDPQAIYDEWDAFTSWAQTAGMSAATPFAVEDLGPPVPRSRQVTKWVSCLTGPVSEVVLPDGGHTDWEVELVAVIGRLARNVSEADAWDHVAGLTAGQDLSERAGQLAGPSPQFSLAKSLPGDVLFTGTPAGVGIGRDPQRWLAPGDELVSYISGIGELRQRFVAAGTTT